MRSTLAGMSGRRWTAAGGLGGTLSASPRPDAEPQKPPAATTAASVTGGASGQRVDFPEPASASAPASRAASMGSLGADELVNMQRLLSRAGLLAYHEPLLGALESAEIESPEALVVALEGELLLSIGVKVFDSARFARMFKEETEGTSGSGSGAGSSSTLVPPPALRMREGQVVSTANEFLFECKLSRYSAELLTTGNPAKCPELSLESARKVRTPDFVAFSPESSGHLSRNQEACNSRMCFTSPRNR